ncbi:MAG: monofunctional biosynthetic peptidoglycan transglycosylase [Trichloromonas sp.]|nr:monofunctional biosynthetic peptidoglycan transglycosylase [Trichloromonas sp.]
MNPQAPMEGKRRSFRRRLLFAFAKAAVGLVGLSLLAVLLLRFVPPVTSAFMAARYAEGVFGARAYTAIDYRWVNGKKISPQMPLAAVAAEDQKFPEHFGFDFEALADAFERLEEGGRLRGGSTISQQVAKNLFLWKGQSFFRKGIEACFTVLIETLWPKRRILEVYLNIAEFGDGVYGVEAAARRYFGKPAAKLSQREAARLAAVLPNPKRFKAAVPSAYVERRTARIERQMRNLGSDYLREVWGEP